MPEAAPRPRAVQWLTAGGVVLGAITWWQLQNPASDTTAPEALWRNGVIVEVRHCAHTTSEAASLRCAAFICAQRVTRQLTNAQQTRLRLSRVERNSMTGDIEVSGDLEQALSSPTLPTHFFCRGATPSLESPTLEYVKTVRGAP